MTEPIATEAQPSRRFNLGDMLIATAAAAWALMPPSIGFLRELPTAIGHAVVLTRQWLDWRTFPVLVGRPIGTQLVQFVLGYTAGLIGPWVEGLTLAVIAWRLRQPRPDRWGLVRQPGFMACLAALVGFVLFLESRGLRFERGGPPLYIAGTVIAAWSLLLVTRTGRAEPGWIDRLGRLAGCGWIALATAAVIRSEY